MTTITTTRNSITYEKPLIWAAAALAVLNAALGLAFVASGDASSWFKASALAWIAFMLIAVGLSLRQSNLFAVIAALFATIVVGRLYGTYRGAGGANTTNDPLLLAETGPGVDGVMWVSTALAVLLSAWILNYMFRHRSETPWGKVNIETWALFFVRLYVGVMFIAHFSGHIFAGPAQFAIFEGYFDSIGLKPAAAMVTLAGIAEVVAGNGLCLGLFTRWAALVGAVFLYLSMLWGNHFPVGYIWILPTGGWEFGIFWAVMVAVFIVTGGGIVSVDRAWRVKPR